MKEDMIESFMVLLVVVGFLLMILSFKWESLMLSSVTLVIWMGLAIGIHQVEIPYQMINLEGEVVTGMHGIENLYMYSIFFIALAFIMIFHMVSMAFTMYQNWERRMM